MNPHEGDQKFFSSTKEMIQTLPRREVVVFEITEITDGVGITGLKVIDHGPRADQEKVLGALDEFITKNPDKQFGMIDTGPQRGHMGSGLILDAKAPKQ